MLLRTARFTNLLLASLLTGNETGTLAAIHPALRTLPTSAHIEAEQALVRRYGAIMPVLMTSVVLSCLPVLVLSRSRRSVSFRLTLAGMTCYAGMLTSTLLGNVPINNRTLELSPRTPPAEWSELRARWERLHTVRVLLDVTGWSCLCLSTLLEKN